MERINNINPKRIEWCCEDYGITPSVLASEVGIAESSMEKVLSREDGLTFNKLRKVADFFGRGVLFFLEEGMVNSEMVHTPQFRTLANQKPELTQDMKLLIERVEKQREIYIALLEDLEDGEQLEFEPPSIFPNDLKKTAELTRKWLRLGEDNDFNSYRAAMEKRGILVFRSNGYNGKWNIPKDNPILGFSLYYPKCPVIVVKKRPWETQQSFTMMHELGHILIHKTSSIDDKFDFQSHEGKERDANAFAGYMLVPDEFLKKISDAGRPEDVSEYDQWLETQRKAWGVSGEVILRRLMDEGRLPKQQYQAYRHYMESKDFETGVSGRRMWRYREPKHIFGDTFVSTVLTALNTQQITLARASTYLDNITIKDLHQLENHYASL